MTIEEMKARKQQAEDGIKAILRAFEEATGLAVESVDVDFKVVNDGTVTVANVSLGIIV